MSKARGRDKLGDKSRARVPSHNKFRWAAQQILFGASPAQAHDGRRDRGTRDSPCGEGRDRARWRVGERWKRESDVRQPAVRGAERSPKDAGCNAGRAQPPGRTTWLISVDVHFAHQARLIVSVSRPSQTETRHKMWHYDVAVASADFRRRCQGSWQNGLHWCGLSFGRYSHGA